MSAYQEFAEEKERIDLLIHLGYAITGVHENLSGAFVDFEHKEHPADHPEKKKQLHILTADARKYFCTVMLAQQRGVL